MAFETLTASTSESGILTITLNRPDKLNALNNLVLNELENLFETAKTDADIKAVIITGTGKAFCAGADINELAEANAQTGLQFANRGQAVFNLLENLGKPSIAAVNGFAFGGGCELSLAATLRIASNTAQFGQPEVKLGVIPGYGGTQRLSRIIGKARAIDLCITGRFVNAEQAYHYGLVSEVVENEKLTERCETILNEISALAPLAVASAIEVIHKGFDLPLKEALQLEAKHFAKLCETDDKREGVSAFLEKRQALFSGK